MSVNNKKIFSEIGSTIGKIAEQMDPFIAGVGNVASSFLTAPAFFANAGQAIKNGITGEFEPKRI